MGLIQAAKDAIGGTLKDQWKEIIECENMSNDILMMEKTTENGVISNKSLIIVAPGQCAIIMENGKVIDATAEEGAYIFDQSSTPSFFAGQFGAVFKEMWDRFTFSGGTAKMQTVYFFNLKEIIGNKFGTPNPIPFQDWSHAIQNQMTGTATPMRVQIKCFGTYTFKICDPSLFMKEIAGTVSVYRKEQLAEQMRSEVLATFQNVTNELGDSAHKVPVLEMPSQTDEIKEMMDQKVFDEPMRNRGISIVGFAVESVTLDEESEAKIDQYELSINQFMQQGRMVDSYSKAMENAASNANGAATGFMGIGIMNQMTGGGANVMGSVFSQNTENSTMKQDPTIPETPAPSQEPTPEPPSAPSPEPAPTPTVEPEANFTPTPEPVAQEPKPEPTTWTCECGQENRSKFCVRCGKQRKEETKNVCPNCGVELPAGTAFCGECGTKIN